MALITDAQARDQIMSLLYTHWTAHAGGVPLGFEDTGFSKPADGSAYGYAFIRKVTGRQATLGGDQGQSRWNTRGTVTVQVRTPQGKGLVLSDSLCGTARDAFRGTRTTGGVVFTNPRVREAGNDGVYTLANVIADFEYDEIA